MSSLVVPPLASSTVDPAPRAPSSARVVATPASAIVAGRAIFARELAVAAKSFLAWALPAAVMLALIVVVQPEMAKEGSVFQAKLELLPREMMVAFGLEKLDLSDPVAYLATNATLLFLLGALFAGVLGATVVSKEEAFGTSELTYVLPVPRAVIVVAKSLAGLVPVVLFDVVLFATAAATYRAIGVTDVDHALLASLFMGGALLHASVFALALAVSVHLAKPRGAMPVALAFVFGLYGAGVVGELKDELSPIGALSPFRVVEPSAIVRDGGLSPAAWALVLVVVAAVIVAVVRVTRKDLHA